MKFQSYNIFLKAVPQAIQNELLAQHTTFKIGGPADLFVNVDTTQQAVNVLKTALDLKIPFIILGQGSNVLISDKGYRGLVIKNNLIGMSFIRDLPKSLAVAQITNARHQAADPKKYLQSDDLDYECEPLAAEVEVYTGSQLQPFIHWTLDNGFTGLQWFAGIPGSIGGAVIQNIHGMSKLFSNYLKSVTVIDKNGKLVVVPKTDLNLDYDYSDLTSRYLMIIKINLLLAKGDLPKANFVYKEWWSRKLKVQPQVGCPGSIFQNFSPEQANQVGAPTPAAGWFIDQCGLKGQIVGGAKFSEKHANFIINDHKAKASDVIQLIKLAKKKVKEKFDLDLIEEIQLIGF